MSEFKYADRNDELTGSLISQNYDPAYWARSEERVLNAAKAYVSEKFGFEGQKALRMLDLGCGMGRLIPGFAAKYREVVGLEPDGERCRLAGEFLAGAKVSNASVWQGSLGEYLERVDHEPGFNVVLCSHIFQHISHETFFGILEDLKRAAAKRAVLIFTTTFTEGENNEYTTESFQASDRVSAVTDREGFEAAVREGDRLPVCRFARPWLEARLREHGLWVRKFSRYHFFGAHNEENDALWTQDPAKRPLARDAWYLCEWTAETEADQETPASGKLAYLQFYSLKEAPEKLPELSERGLQEISEENCGRGDCKVLADFRTAESFLYGSGLHFPAKRYLVTKYRDLKLADREGRGIPIDSSHVLLTLYPSLNACQVSVCLKVGKTPVRDFIYLHQIQCSRDVEFRWGEPEEKISVPEICDQVLAAAKLIPFSDKAADTDAKADSKADPKTDANANAIITELNTLGERSNTENLTDSETCCIYGVLSGDEGWQHVPVSMARERLKLGWGSRDFAQVAAFAKNFVLLNFNGGDSHNAYIKKQRPFANQYWGGLNDYFLMDAETAGVNHGLFFSVEAGMLIRVVTERLLNTQPKRSEGSSKELRSDIQKSKEYREEMIRIMKDLETVNISELGELDALVMRSLDSKKQMESLRNILELVESDLDLIYQTKTNKTVNILTVVGLILALLEVLLAVGDMIWSYLLTLSA